MSPKQDRGEEQAKKKKYVSCRGILQENHTDKWFLIYFIFYLARANVMGSNLSISSPDGILSLSSPSSLSSPPPPQRRLFACMLLSLAQEGPAATNIDPFGTALVVSQGETKGVNDKRRESRAERL